MIAGFTLNQVEKSFKKNFFSKKNIFFQKHILKKILKKIKKKIKKIFKFFFFKKIFTKKKNNFFKNSKNIFGKI